MLLRDRLLARLAEMGAAPDHQRLAAEVLGIRNAPPELARRLVAQALVVEDRRDAWRRAGERIAANAPAGPGVLRPAGRNRAGCLRRQGEQPAAAAARALRRTALARPESAFARIAGAEWHEVGSEIEALLREASLIEELRPEANVQVAAPSLETRAIPARLVRDVIVVVPSVDPASAELVAARADGGWLLQRTPRDGSRLKSAATLLTRFFRSPLRDRFESPRLAPIVFSWLAARGASASRIDPHDAPTVAGLRVRLRRCWRTRSSLPNESLC